MPCIQDETLACFRLLPLASVTAFSPCLVPSPTRPTGRDRALLLKKLLVGNLNLLVTFGPGNRSDGVPGPVCFIWIQGLDR